MSRTVPSGQKIIGNSFSGNLPASDELAQVPLIDTIGNLPSLYSNWFVAILPGPLPVEIEATCSDCAMCLQSGEPDSAELIFFDRDSKCCSYSPTLSNFMLGAILTDQTPAMMEGRNSLMARLKEGLGVSPLAVLPPPSYSLLYRHSPNAFGRNRRLRCPHFISVSGTCGIWRYREPTCVTWFCKHLRGKIGQTFWARLRTYLNSISYELSLWCVLQLDIGSDGLVTLESLYRKELSGENLLPNELDGLPDLKNARKIWGPWWGRETAFYIECFNLVSKLSYREIEEICGPEVKQASRLVQEAYAQLKTIDIPAKLKLGRFKVEGGTRDSIRIWSYSRLDPLDLPLPIFVALSNFNGRPTSAVLSSLAEKSGVQLNTQLLRTLIDFGILESG